MERGGAGRQVLSAPADRHRVAIVGGGFGGLFAAMALVDSAVDVTVIDRTNHHMQIQQKPQASRQGETNA